MSENFCHADMINTITKTLKNAIFAIQTVLLAQAQVQMIV